MVYVRWSDYGIPSCWGLDHTSGLGDTASNPDDAKTDIDWTGAVVATACLALLAHVLV